MLLFKWEVKEEKSTVPLRMQTPQGLTGMKNALIDKNSIFTFWVIVFASSLSKQRAEMIWLRPTQSDEMYENLARCGEKRAKVWSIQPLVLYREGGGAKTRKYKTKKTKTW